MSEEVKTTKICKKCGVKDFSLFSSASYSKCEVCVVEDRKIKYEEKKQAFALLSQEEKFPLHDRVCSTCKTEKSCEMFLQTCFGYSSKCKLCISETNKKRWWKGRIDTRGIPESEFKSRICTSCKMEKEFKFFSKHSKAKFGLCEKCKTCCSKEAKEKRRLKREEREAAKSLIPAKVETHRICIKCNIEKELCDFGNHKKERNGISTMCKVCRRAYENDLYVKKRAKMGLQVKHPIKRTEEERRKARAEYRLKYAAENPEYQKEWRAKNKEKINEYRRKKIESDLQFKFRTKIRSRIHTVLKRNINNPKKAGKTVELLGCSFEELRAHIEKLFLPGMNFDNFMTDIVNLDHIIPVSSFDLTDPEQQKKCFHFTNLMPRWSTTAIALENGSNQIGNKNKSDKIIGIDFHEPLL